MPFLLVALEGLVAGQIQAEKGGVVLQEIDDGRRNGIVQPVATEEKGGVGRVR